jgi:nitrogen fixation NifU-like protein
MPKERARELILEHAESPVCWGRLQGATHTASLSDAGTADTVTVDLLVNEGRLEALGWEASGSTALMASGSLMAQCLYGQKLSMACQKTRLLLQNMTARETLASNWAVLGEAAALAGFRDFPARVRCTTLPWRTALAALDSTALAGANTQAEAL